jgi:hypothetical protein
MASKNLFITVDGKGNLVETTGTFSIGRKAKKDAPETIIFTSNYSKGSAPTPLVYEEDDIIFVSPVGFLSMSTTEAGAKLQLVDSARAIETSLEEKRSYVSSKIGDR